MRSAARQTRVHRGTLLLGVVGLALVLASWYRAADGSLTPRTDGRALAPLVLGALVGAFLIAVAVVRPFSGSASRLHLAVGCFSVLCLVGVGCLWHLESAARRSRPDVGPALLDAGDVADVLDREPGLRTGAGGEERLIIPTGVFIQSVEFVTASNVEVSGYVWQRYAGSIPAEVERGIVLPEALEEAYEAREVFRYDEGGDEVIGWYVHAVLRQQFDYGRYPFDRHDVWVRLWHPDLARRPILVPDFASYASMVPSSLPGMEERFVYEGWIPEFTAFSLVPHRYSTTLGQRADAVGVEGFPELYYSIGLKRAFASRMVSHLVPLAVVLLLLFVCLSLTTRDPDRRRAVAFDTGAAIGSCAALLFVALIDHNRIRDEIPPGRIAYLEILWFVLYAVILLVALNAAWSAAGHGHRTIVANDNAPLRLLYWPIVSGLVLVATLVVLSP